MKSVALAVLVATAITAGDVQNVLVYKEAGRFGGWPANHGIWSWGNEIRGRLQRGIFQAHAAGPASIRQYEARRAEARP